MATAVSGSAKIDESGSVPDANRDVSAEITEKDQIL